MGESSSYVIVSIVLGIIAIIPGILALRQQEKKATNDAEKSKSEREKLEDDITERVIKRASVHIDSLELEINELKDWQAEVVDFIVPFVKGSKLNEQELIKNGIEPPYKLPDLPRWING